GAVDRARLAKRLGEQPARFAELEAIVHPLVRADREAFAARAKAEVAVFDIPLLLETGQAEAFDAVVVCEAPADVQRARVLARPGMTSERLEAILARQAPAADKRAKADFVVDTGSGLEAAREQVHSILARVTAPDWTPRANRRT
ncbi:MAG TPA: dephospho-CoA kinase, partial [Caulobacteraceae bacterium]